MSVPSEAAPSAADLSVPSGANAPGQLHVNDAHVVSSYANFCRVTGTPEELIIDFGLNIQPFEASPDPIEVVQRTVLNFYTAKRLLHALHLTLERHEAAFGVLEIDVQKRITPGWRG